MSSSNSLNEKKMKIVKSVLFAAILIPSICMAQFSSNDGQMYWQSIKCGGVTADLMVNHRTVAQPTLFLNNKAFKLEDGPDYSGPICVSYRGEKKIGYYATMGNAAAAYTLVDLDTFKRSEISFELASKLGFFK